jgi:anti-sigma factor RsiW
VIEDKDLHAYVDGQLAPDRRRAVELYLANHPEAALRVADWRAQNRALALAFGPVAEEPLPGRLLDVATGPAPAPEPHGIDRRVALAASVAFVAGGLTALAAMRLAGRLEPRGATDPLSGFLGVAKQAHQVFTPETRHPVEIAAADQAQLLDWLSKRLDYPMALPDLQAYGLTLVGGRMLTGPRGPAAFFVFETDKAERVTMYCARLGPVADAQPKEAVRDGLTTVYWVDDGIGFALTAAGTNRADALRHLAGGIFDAMEAAHPRS